MTQVKFKIRKGDLVQVMTGKHKGRRGAVISVLKDDNKVVVEGVNCITRHIKPSAANPDGSIAKTLPIHISNVAVVDTLTDNTSKIGFKFEEDGSKVRFFKKSGNSL